METAVKRRRKEARILSFAIPVLVMLCIFIARGIFPFGDRSFLHMDLYHQYAPFFSEFQYKITHGKSLFFTWDVGLGVNFSAVYAYYLACPLNWLIAFCPKKYVIEFITYMIVFKTALCGLTMTIYLQAHTEGRETGAEALFGVFYALSAYMAAYNWNIMWLDCIFLFPLIALGAERLVEGKSAVPYTLCLALAITSNYYISIMICIFLVIYAVCRAFLTCRSRREVCAAALRFAVCSLIAGGIAMAVLLPEIYALSGTASGNFSFPKTFRSYFSIFDMLARHMGNIDCETGLDYWPNIYCGVAVYQFILLYFANRKVSLKEKAVYGSLLIFFLASFSINVLDYVWHGFHFPNSLPARQSFIYIFLVLFLSFRAFDKKDGNTLKHQAIAFAAAFVFILYAQEFVDQDHFHFWTYYVAMLFTALYALLLWSWKTKRLHRELILYLAMVLTCVESAANFAYSSVSTVSRTNYVSDNEAVMRLRDSVPDEPFVRFEKVGQRSKDEGAFLQFHAASIFSSMAYKALTSFMRDLGCESSTNAYSINGSTPLVDALLDVKYAFYPSENLDPALKLLSEDSGMYLYENPDTFSLGFLVPTVLERDWNTKFENPADVQNDLCRAMGTDPVLLETVGQQDGKNYLFTAPEDGIYYVFVTNGKVKKVEAELPGATRTFDNVNRRYLLEIGLLHRGETVSLSIADDSATSLEARTYRFDYDALHALKEELGSQPMTETEVTDTRVAGTVNAEESSVLFTSIPYDKGWSVKIDGKDAETESYLDTFLSVRVPAGEHTIEFTFFPQGLKLGILITVLSLTLFGLLCAEERRRCGKVRKNRPGRLYRVGERKEPDRTAESGRMAESDKMAEPDEMAEPDGTPEPDGTAEPDSLEERAAPAETAADTAADEDAGKTGESAGTADGPGSGREESFETDDDLEFLEIDTEEKE